MKPFLQITASLVVAILLTIGCSSSSGPDDDLTPPPVPSGLSISSIGNGSASLTWEPVSDKGLKGYNVYWSASAPADTLHGQRVFTAETNMSITGLDYTTLYYFAVSAIDKSGNESSLSMQESGIPGNTTGPRPPNGMDVIAENVTEPQITISWLANDEPDITHYNIYRALTALGLEDSTAFLTDVDQPGYIDTDIDVSVSYYYRVTAVDAGGWESVPSPIVSDTALAPVELVYPLNFQYVSGTPTFSWEPLNNAAKYQVVVTTSRLGGEIWNIEVDNTTSELVYSGKTKLTPGEKYYWRVGAISRSEVNSVSEIGSFQVQE